MTALRRPLAQPGRCCQDGPVQREVAAAGGRGGGRAQAARRDGGGRQLLRRAPQRRLHVSLLLESTVTTLSLSLPKHCPARLGSAGATRV